MARIAVIGIGGAGGAALRFCAAAGHEAVGYEQFNVGHNRGSSHGATRILRYTYPDPLKTRMVREALSLWRTLEEEANTELFVQTGSVLLGEKDDAYVQDTLSAYRDSGLPFAIYSGENLHERFPALRLRPDEIGLHQPESGFLRANEAVLANARLARAHGAIIHEETHIEHLAQRGAEVIVRTSTGEERAFDAALVTAGPWTAKLFPRAALPLTPSRQQVIYLKIARSAANFAPSHCPVWVDNTLNYYGFPIDGRIEGVKLASHAAGPMIDPDASRFGGDINDWADEDLARAIEYAAFRLPDLSPETTFTSACLYTNTPDEEFVFDRAPDAPNVWVISGCSGHGFKFTVILGKIAAELATGGGAGRAIGAFSLSRFAAREGKT